jgi:hypothetical protein
VLKLKAFLALGTNDVYKLSYSSKALEGPTFVNIGARYFSSSLLSLTTRNRRRKEKKMNTFSELEFDQE